MGGSSSGGADTLLSRINLEGLAANDDGSKDDRKNQQLDLQLGYGLLSFGNRFTLTPESGLGFYDSGRDYRTGWRLTHLPETGALSDPGRPLVLSSLLDPQSGSARTLAKQLPSPALIQNWGFKGILLTLQCL